jgi:hypothetical protein
MNPFDLHLLRRRIIKFFFREQWSVLICDKNKRLIKQLVPAKNIHWADPFPVLYNDRFYLFMEQQITGKNGILGFVELYKDFSYSDFKPILEKEYHLSWPNVFCLDSVWYMIPETHEHKKIDLYRAVDFPDKWQFHSTLIDDIDAVDTALFFYKNNWWLFTSPLNDDDSHNSSLLIFKSPAFPSSQWQPCPYNPAVTGSYKSRMAGNIFIDIKENRIIRPSQNCRKIYGQEVILNRIELLSEKEYHEETDSVVSPERGLHAFCTHTYNTCGPYLVRDIKTRRFSLYPLRKRF